MHWPNLLTSSRIAIVPLLVLIYYLPFDWRGIAASALFVFASLTDALDGYLARQLGQQTRSGEFLDPVADKLLVAVALILIVDRMGQDQIGISIAATTIIWREIAISALRQWAESIHQSKPLPVSWLGKLKTTLQMVAITLLLLGGDVGGDYLAPLGAILLYFAALVSVVSMIDYFLAFRRIERGG